MSVLSAKWDWYKTEIGQTFKRMSPSDWDTLGYSEFNRAQINSFDEHELTTN